MTRRRTARPTATIIPLIESGTLPERGVMGRFNRYLVTAAMMFVAAAINSSAFSQPASGTTVWDGVYADEQSKRGAEVSKASCVSCHGD